MLTFADAVSGEGSKHYKKAAPLGYHPGLFFQSCVFFHFDRVERILVSGTTTVLATIGCIYLSHELVQQLSFPVGNH